MKLDRFDFFTIIITVSILLLSGTAIYFLYLLFNPRDNRCTKNRTVSVYAKIGKCTMYEVSGNCDRSKYFTDCVGVTEWSESNGKHNVDIENQTVEK